MKTIKYLFLSLTATAAIAGLTSCDSRKTLAEKIEGTWATDTPSYDQIGDALSSSYTTFLQFNVEPTVVDPLGGNFMVSTNFELTFVAPQSDEIVQPYTISPTGIASASGTWTATDDDEISIVMDPGSFMVSVDPKTIVLEDNVLTGENMPQTDSIKASMASKVEQIIGSYFQSKFININKIDDVKIRGEKLQAEINDMDYSFSRQAIIEIPGKE